MKTLFDAELGIKSDYKSFFKKTTFKTGTQVTRLVIKEYFKKCGPFIFYVFLDLVTDVTVTTRSVLA